MRKRRKEQPVIEGLEITDVASEGNAIAHLPDGKVVFIPYGAPGDVADVKIIKNKRQWAQGRIERLVKPSEVRQVPRCQHFGICGGCAWQHLPYELQLQCKQRQVSDALQRIAKVSLPQITPILGSDDIWGYRNKMEYTFSCRSYLTPEEIASGVEVADREACGFHVSGAFDKVLNIEACHLQSPLGDKLRLWLKDYAKSKGYTFYNIRANEGLLRTIMIRLVSTGQSMAVVSFGEDQPEAVKDVMDAMREAFPELTSLQYVINLKANDSITDQEVILHSGQPFIEEEMEGLRFRLGPKSFYQTNSRQAYKLYSVVREEAGLQGDELVYDLYTGTGTIANFVSRQARKVIGIEYVPEAIEDAKVNSQVNGIANTDFYAGDMKAVLTDDFVDRHGHPDVIIVDPPRDGMHPDVVGVLLRTRAPKVVYVSCNPATQARDLALLDEAYSVTSVRPVDMFPHTRHVENVVTLRLKENNKG